MIGAPRFWQTRSWRSAALRPVALAYGAIAGRRMRRPASLVSTVPVICVGNFTLGGAGKTPVALALARIARGQGLTPVFVSRGYGGRSVGPVLVDPELHGAAEIGDEPLLLARAAQTIVARDRAAGVDWAAALAPDLIVLDDGLQNPTVAKDLRLVVVDAAFGVGNGLVFPAGPLRAPLAVQWDAADAVILVGDDAATARARLPWLTEATQRGLPILTARLAPREPDRWAGRRVIGFAGIGRPDKFAATLASIGATLVAFAPFPDHHRYTEAEARALLERAERLQARLVTTEKDFVRLGRGAAGSRRELARTAEVLAVDLAFDDEAAIRSLLDAALYRARQRR